MKKKITLDKLTIKSFKTTDVEDVVVKGGRAPSYIDFTMCDTNCSCPPMY